jgi:tripartite-type tricarboxylate transporter receptor subunit TctC
VLSGELALGVASVPSAGLPDHVKTGRLRGLAVTSAKRSKAVPDVPTMVESGFPGFDVTIWYGMLAPAGTSQEIVTRLNKELIRILTLPVVRERMATFDFDIATSTPAEFGDYIKREVAQWTKVVRDAGVTIN